MLHHVMRVLPELRFQPTLKHLTVRLGSDLVAETGHAMLVWEPKRVVPTYAVPQRDVTASLVPAAVATEDTAKPVALGDGPPVLDPRTGFGVHTTDGEALDVVTGSALAANGAFRPDDPDLTGYLLLDFDAFDWPAHRHHRGPCNRRGNRPAEQVVTKVAN